MIKIQDPIIEIQLKSFKVNDIRDKIILQTFL